VEVGRRSAVTVDGRALSWDGVQIVSLRGARLLWVPSAAEMSPGAPLPTTLAALHSAPADLALLAQGFARDGTSASLQGLAAALARLRRERLLAPDCDVVVLADPSSCGVGSLDRLSNLVAPWGARLARTADEILPRGAPAGRVARRHLVTGPSASGKSAWAEHVVG
jgi:hypothetical protein